MVGIPGKSQGCHTCRRRKVKCDLATPNCERCSKRGLACEGYQRGPVFINRTAQGLVKRKPLEEAQSRDDANLQILGSDAMGNGSMIAIPGRAEIDAAAQRLGTQMGVNHVMLKRIRSLFEEQYIFSASKPAQAGQGAEFPGLWLLKCIDLSQPDQAFEYSSTALAFSRVGKAMNNTDLVLRGRFAYGQALRELQAAHLDPIRVVKDDILAACQALAHYEFLEPSENPISDHLRHLSGMLRLLKYRRSKLPETELGIAPVNYVRFTSMITCVQYRSISLIGSLKAKNELWGDSNTVEQKVYDKGFILAVILGQIDTAGSVQHLQTLLKQCFQLDEELKILSEETLDFEGWKDSQFPLASQLGDEPEGDLVFPDICIAHLTLVIWGVRLGVKMTTLMLYKKLAEMASMTSKDGREHISSLLQYSRAPSSQAPLENDSRMIASRKKGEEVASGLCLASYVLRAVPYCIRNYMGLSSTMRSIFSLRAAIGMFRFFSPSSPRLKKAEELVGKIAAKDIPFAMAITKHSGKWGDTDQ